MTAMDFDHCSKAKVEEYFSGVWQEKLDSSIDETLVQVAVCVAHSYTWPELPMGWVPSYEPKVRPPVSRFGVKKLPKV